jgi:hypothetical protein
VQEVLSFHERLLETDYLCIPEWDTDLPYTFPPMFATMGRQETTALLYADMTIGASVVQTDIGV